jgi:hypothetical protein
METAPHTVPEPPLIYDKPALTRVFRGRRVVDQLIASGQLPVRELQGRVVVLRDDLLEFLRNLPRR